MRCSTKAPLLVLGTALACGTPGEVQPPVDQPFSLRIGRTAVFPNAHLSITFRAVPEDSRCPSDVVCVWEGNGQVELLVRVSDAVDTLVLNTGSEPRMSPVGPYRLRLVGLAPQPEAAHPIPPGSYVATFELLPP